MEWLTKLSNASRILKRIWTRRFPMTRQQRLPAAPPIISSACFLMWQGSPCLITSENEK